MRYLEFIKETPISDFAVDIPTDKLSPRVNNEKPKRGNIKFYDIDQKLLNNEKYKVKLFRAFEKTPFIFNFYVIYLDDNKLPGLKFTQEQLIKLIESKLSRKIITDGRITCLYTNGVTANYIPMTPWIFAHRLMHAIQIAPHGPQILEPSLYNFLIDIIKRLKPYSFDLVYMKTNDRSLAGSFNINYDVKYLSEILFTMKSAREKKVGINDITGEILAQYLITGKIKFNRIENLNNLKYIKGLINLENLDLTSINQEIADGEIFIAKKCEEQLQSLVGKVISF